MMEAKNGPMNDNDPTTIIVGLIAIFYALLTIIGLVLGLVGVFQTDRNPALAIVGTVINGIVILGGMSLICAGVLMGG